MESDVRYYRRRASEEIAAASRAVTEAARDRRLQLARVYLQRLGAPNDGSPVFDWFDKNVVERV